MSSGMRVVATVESRMTSSRLPGKSMLPILGKPMLGRLLERLKRSRRADVICVATTDDPRDDVLIDLARGEGVEVFRGSVDDVLSRVLGAAKSVQADIIAEITGDCPLVDPGILDAVLGRYLKGGHDYVANILDCLTFPAGLDVQVYSVALLEEVSQLTQEPADRADVTPFIYHNPDRYRLLNVQAPPDLCRPDYWLAVDYRQDFEVVSSVYRALYNLNPDFDARAIIHFLDSRSDVVANNSGLHNPSDHPSSDGKALQEVLSI